MTKIKTTKPAPPRKPAKGGARKRPAAKAGKTGAERRRKAEKKPEIVRRKLVWRGVSIAIRYEPKACGLFASLELRVVAPKGAPIPTTKTGYSHYIYPAFVKNEGGPVAYIRKWLDREAGNPSYHRALDRWRQLDLFP